MKRQGNKKGFLFSLLLMFMLIMILSMALVSKEISNQNYDALESLLLAKRIRYIESDVATDFLSILNISINASKTNFSIFNLYLKDYSKNISGYNDFLKAYSNLTNIAFIANISNEIYVNSNLLNFSNETLFYNDTSDVTEITIEIEANEFSSGGLEYTPVDSGSTPINCIITDSNNAVLYNKTRYLDTNSSNQAFWYSYKGENISITIANNQLKVLSNTTTIIKVLSIDFASEYAYVEAGEIRFEEYAGLSKEARILLRAG